MDHLLLGTVCLCVLLGRCSTDRSPGPPETPRVDHEEVMHGVSLSDPYHWLEDLESPSTQTWIAAQNAHSSDHFAQLPGRELLHRRLSGMMQVDRVLSPIERGGRYFYSKKPAEEDLWTIYYRDGSDSEDSVLIDPYRFSEDKSASVNLHGISHDGRLVAYAVRRSGQDEVEVLIRNVDRGEDIPDSLPKGLYSGVAFTKDKKAFFYSRRNRETGSRIFHHFIGTDPSQDRVVFGEGFGPDVFLGLSVSDDGEYLLLGAYHGWTRSEIWVQKSTAQSPAQPVVRNIEALFDPEWAGPGLIAVQTGWNASNRRILLIDVENPSPDAWREVVPERADAIQNFSVIAGKLFVNYLHNATTRIRIFTLDGVPSGEVPLPENATGRIFGRWNSREAFLDYSSFAIPEKIFRYDGTTGEQKLWFDSRIPVAEAAFEAKQVWYSSKDGTQVPMFLVHKKGLQLDGRRPVLLGGYGGFNVSMTPLFNPLVVLWAERDGVFALPNLRGGGEFGDEWHRGGMLANKQNVFDDFIAAAEWLIRNNYTNPQRLAIQGGSNGDLLVAAALTQRPDLFQAVVCAYPDLDMVRYWRYKENNNPPALLEYGDASKPKHFSFLRAYSPYERVESGIEYPAVLLTTGEGDTRVPPQQALKMAAKLQWATRSRRPILLRFDAKSGHAGGRPLSRVIEDVAAEQAFLLSQLGVE